MLSVSNVRTRLLRTRGARERRRPRRRLAVRPPPLFARRSCVPTYQNVLHGHEDAGRRDDGDDGLIRRAVQQFLRQERGALFRVLFFLGSAPASGPGLSRNEHIVASIALSNNACRTTGSCAKAQRTRQRHNAFQSVPGRRETLSPWSSGLKCERSRAGRMFRCDPRPPGVVSHRPQPPEPIVGARRTSHVGSVALACSHDRFAPDGSSHRLRRARGERRGEGRGK